MLNSFPLENPAAVAKDAKIRLSLPQQRRPHPPEQYQPLRQQLQLTHNTDDTNSINDSSNVNGNDSNDSTGNKRY
ncbi:MAG: hypothetical protein U0103_21715 [Candidatus Obscuribacterales bacterium]